MSRNGWLASFPSDDLDPARLLDHEEAVGGIAVGRDVDRRIEPVDDRLQADWRPVAARGGGVAVADAVADGDGVVAVDAVGEPDAPGSDGEGLGDVGPQPATMAAMASAPTIERAGMGLVIRGC